MQARFPAGASCKFAHGSDGGPQEKRRRATCVPAVESIPVPELHDSDALDREQTCYLFTHLVSTRTKFVEPEETFAAKQEKGSSHYCADHPPESILCVWPAKGEVMRAAWRVPGAKP